MVSKLHLCYLHYLVFSDSSLSLFSQECVLDHHFSSLNFHRWLHIFSFSFGRRNSWHDRKALSSGVFWVRDWDWLLSDEWFEATSTSEISYLLLHLYNVKFVLEDASEEYLFQHYLLLSWHYSQYSILWLLLCQSPCPSSYDSRGHSSFSLLNHCDLVQFQHIKHSVKVH